MLVNKTGHDAHTKLASQTKESTPPFISGAAFFDHHKDRK
jgi:hypothetical protein